MKIINGTTAEVDFPGVFTGTAGRQGAELAFWSATPVQRVMSGTIDGEPVRVSIQPHPLNQRRRGGMQIVTPLS